LDTIQYYLLELKEQGVMVVKWKPGKNLARKAFEKQNTAFKLYMIIYTKMWRTTQR